MTAALFPNLDEAQDWYSKTRDGLLLLRSATSPLTSSSRQLLSNETLDELHGMTQSEWEQFHANQIGRHEIFCTLALFAACEGGIRKDLEWRHDGNVGQRHHIKFKHLQQNAHHHLTIIRILETWRTAEKNNKWLDGSFSQLIALFKQRNDLAHGLRGLSATTFTVVATKLRTIRQKWRDAVDDFQGF